MLIQGTWRGEEVPPNQRFRQLLAEVQRARRGAIISLACFNRAKVKQLLGSLGDFEFTETLGDRLFQETEGLPYFILECLASLPQPGHSHIIGDWPIPGSVQELLRFRLSHICDMEMQILSTTAVIGRSFGFDNLREARGQGEDE